MIVPETTHIIGKTGKLLYQLGCLHWITSRKCHDIALRVSFRKGVQLLALNSYGANDAYRHQTEDGVPPRQTESH